MVRPQIASDTYLGINRNMSPDKRFCGGCNRLIEFDDLCFEARQLYKEEGGLYNRGNTRFYYHPDCFAPAYTKEIERQEAAAVLGHDRPPERGSYRQQGENR